MKKVVCLHGFLGSEEDFKFLAGEFELFCPNLDPYILEKDIKKLIYDIETFKQNDPLYLVGYSFGSRLSTEVIKLSPDLFEKIFLIAGHAGLKSVKEREERIEVEKEFLRAIESKKFEDFCHYWNQLDLFKFDDDIKPVEKTISTMKSYFFNFGLSKQNYNLECLKRVKDKIRWVFGSKDKKYSDYAKIELYDFNISFLEGVGHRVLKNEIGQDFIRKELINA